MTVQCGGRPIGSVTSTTASCDKPARISRIERAMDMRRSLGSPGRERRAPVNPAWSWCAGGARCRFDRVAAWSTFAGPTASDGLLQFGYVSAAIDNLPVTLREWSDSDADWYAASTRDPAIQRFTTESAHLTADEVRDAIRALLAGDNPHAGLIITDAPTGQRLGNIAVDDDG
jgi:hypothetical protein